MSRGYTSTQIPSLRFSNYPYSRPAATAVASSRRSAHRDAVNDSFNTDHTSLKVQLRNRLNSCRLSSMPAGFPFHHDHDGHGSYRLVYDSFEFHEDFLTSARCDARPQYQSVAIAFESPSWQSKTRHLTWRAYLPAANTSRSRGSQLQGEAVVAQVRVDPAVLKTPYGRTLTTDPSVILRALAISLELGVLITIQISAPLPTHPPAPYYLRSLPRKSQTHQLGKAHKDSIVYMSTRTDGYQEPLFMVSQ